MLSRANIVKGSFSMRSLFNCRWERGLSVVFPFLCLMQVQVLPFLLVDENTLMKASALYLKGVDNEPSRYRIIFGIRERNGHPNGCIPVIRSLSNAEYHWECTSVTLVIVFHLL